MGAKKARGELVDAFYNQGSRQWEAAPSYMLKDPLLSTMVHLKPPSQVSPITTKTRVSRRPAKTIDNVDVDKAYLARKRCHRMQLHIAICCYIVYADCTNTGTRNVLVLAWTR